MHRSDDITQLAISMCKIQAEIENVTKDKDNPFFRSKYADLGSILDLIRPILAKHGLSIIQMLSSKQNSVGIETIVLHESGEFISEKMYVPLALETISKNGELKKLTTSELAQASGSVITYLRRYSYTAVLGIAQVDDDGNLPVKIKATDRQKQEIAALYRDGKKGLIDDYVTINKISSETMTIEQANSLIETVRGATQNV